VKKVALLPILVLALLPFGASSALAEDQTCIGVLPPSTYDSVVVPPGQNCSISGSVVRGNIKALENSQLVVEFSTVHGNIDGDKADLVQVNFTTVLPPFSFPLGPVHGNITIKEGGPAHAPFPAGAIICDVDSNPCEVAMAGTTVRNGDVQVEKMEGSLFLSSSMIQNGNVKFEQNVIPNPTDDFLSIAFNDITGNLQVFKNKGPGSKLVVANNVGGNLQCKENDPPFVNLVNTVDGDEDCPNVP
jgi:hypothetical protein